MAEEKGGESNWCKCTACGADAAQSGGQIIFDFLSSKDCISICSDLTTKKMYWSTSLFSYLQTTALGTSGCIKHPTIASEIKFQQSIENMTGIQT